MNPRFRLPRLRLLSCLAVMALWPAVSLQAQEARPETVRTPTVRDHRTTAPRVSRGELALARARTAMQTQDFATAHNEYRVAADSSRGVAGMEKVFADAVRGFAESGVKLAQQRKAQGRIPEAERILREILSPRFNPKYAPALELLARLRPPAAPRIQGFGVTPPPAATIAPLPAASPRVSGERSTRRSGPAPAPTVAPESKPRTPPPEVAAEEEEEEATPPPKRTPSDETTAAKKPLVEVYFGTDRLPSGSRGPSKYFGVEWNKARDPLITGVVTVSIPPVHKEGQVERPGTFLYFWERREDAKKHFVLKDLRVVKGNDFYGELRREFDERADEDRSAFVYVHGFNVKFDDAVYATAQIVYDLDFKGVPMLFSWPSQGSVLAYNGDQDTVDFSSPNLQSFLERVARETGALRIHVMAHSMGNRLLTRALEGLVRQPDIQPLFDNVIMASPDVNARVFTGIWPQIKIAAKRFTLYASSDDKALIASRAAKGGSDFTRLGEAGPNITVIPGLDTIDASGIDTSLLGHSYEASCKPVRDDLGLLIGKGFDPEQRKLRQDRAGLGFWSFP